MNDEEKIRQIKTEIPPYNSMDDPLELQGYGRNIKKMVDICIKIEDRKERTRCAYTIVGTMRNVRKDLDTNNEEKHVFWDHLNAMAGGNLDIDYPNNYKPVSLKNMDKPQKMEYPTKILRYRHYGYNIQQLIKAAAEKEDGVEKEDITIAIANQMKRDYINYNKDSVTDSKIYDDLAEMSEGKLPINRNIKLLDNDFVLRQNQSNDSFRPAKNKKKKLKKKRRFNTNY